MAALSLSQGQVARLKESLFGMAAAVGEEHHADLSRFCTWVQERDFSYIIDGANVAYHNQNLSGRMSPRGHFSYRQVEVARQNLLERELGRMPLLVLPQKYLPAGRSVGESVPNSIRGLGSNERWRCISADDASCLDVWHSSGTMWPCPLGSDDDWYWILASLTMGSRARVLTNDKMRDHAMLMSPNLLQRWRDRHITRFDFSRSEGATYTEPTITLSEPSLFSWEIQCSEAGWHFPSSEDDAWLCVTGVGT